MALSVPPGAADCSEMQALHLLFVRSCIWLCYAVFNCLRMLFRLHSTAFGMFFGVACKGLDSGSVRTLAAGAGIVPIPATALTLCR